MAKGVKINMETRFVKEYRCADKNCNFRTCSRKLIRRHVKAHMSSGEKGRDLISGKVKRNPYSTSYETVYSV